MNARKIASRLLAVWVRQHGSTSARWVAIPASLDAGLSPATRRALGI